MDNGNLFESTFGYKLIYVFRINDNAHKGIVKIGDATIHYENSIDDLKDNCDILNQSARKRIDQYTKTAGIRYELLYTTIAIMNNGKAFRDYKVHDLLKRSGIEKKFLNKNNRNEWFEIDLETAIKAINAVKEGKNSLNSSDITHDNNPIILRPEQEEAVKKTIKNFETSDRMLWNAKMRFGKTICALEIVKRKQYSKTIILTHRPVVDDGWFEDFNKIFSDDKSYKYGSKNKGERIESLIRSNDKFVYFASIQDLRGSSEVGGTFQKNELVFNTQWDFVVIDEAHEGTKTNRGERTIEGVIKINDNHPTKLLELSGTPFNLLSDYEEKEIYTWDYVMEQSAKLEWEVNHDGDYNPYEDLPQMNILTYDLNRQFGNYIDVGDKSFNFREFFRTWTGITETDRKEMPEGVKKGDFVHESDVRKFLDLLVLDNNTTNYPYSKEKYREYFRHSLWMIPGVKEAKALSKLLKEHTVFGSGMFKIVNVAGDGDEEDTQKSKELVDSAITNHPEETYTITLSCGRLTTGVSIPAWSAVFMLNGGNSTSASSYLQTIFRVQTPANIGGKMKDKCYVFDFAPDRTLKMLAEAGQLSCKPGSVESKTKMGDLLNFCPVIAVDGSRMIPYNVDTMLRTLKKAYADRVVQNGFDDTRIYNDKLLKLDGLELEEFEKLKGIIGVSKQSKKVNELDINRQGFTDEEWEKLEQIKKKPKEQLTQEDIELQQKKKEQKDQRSKAISILRGISIRIPLMVYGAELTDEQDVTVDNFTEIIDDKSWEEFMPKGVTKEMFKQFSKYYDSEIFVEAGNRIRNITKYADTLNPTERTKEIANLFATFKNPDKETVLTPWKTVNMHMGDTIGGYNFYDEKYIVTIEEPRLILNGEVTTDVLNNKSSKVLEINSKSGLYPLYVSYSIFRQRCLDTDAKKLDEELEKALWEETLKENIYVITKTKMGKSITKRTLAGYEDFYTNIICDENIIDNITNNQEDLCSYLLNPKNWGKEYGETMKFNAIVGNPPYNIIDGGGGSSSKPIYNKFVELSIDVAPSYISMIMPSRWFSGGKGLDEFRKNMIKDKRIKILHDYIDSKVCFNNVSIEGGVCYFLWEKNSNDKCDIYNHSSDGTTVKEQRFLSENDEIDVLIRNKISLDILKKVLEKKDNNFSDIVYPRNVFKIDNELDKYFSHEKSNLRILARIDNCRQYRFLTDDFTLKSGKNLVDKYKIFVSKADGAAGQLGNPIPAKIIGKPEFGEINDICTETFLVIGPFDTKDEMINVSKYLKTKFCRYMIGIRKNKNMTQDTYKYVPLQNFSNNSDVDWKQGIEQIDNYLFKKYKLNDSEINEINEKII